MTDVMCFKCEKDIPNEGPWDPFDCPHCGAHHVWDEQPIYDETGEIVDTYPFYYWDSGI